MVKIERTITADVLVVGGGGAACTAAVAAARKGAGVALVSKGKVGNSGNTIMIGGSYGMDGESACHRFNIEEADPNFTREELFQSIVKDGFYLSDQNMVEQFVEESPGIVYEMKQWGEEAGQHYRFYSPSMWDVTGRSVGRSLTQGIKKTGGIEKYEDILVFELVKSGETVTGAVGLDLCNGQLVLFQAKAVILGTGGFQPFSFKNTNTDMTGDGQAMAYRAGAGLADMEFMLFLITALEPNEMKGSILPVIMLFREAFGYEPVDKNGVKISVPDKLRAMEKTSELCKLVHLFYYGRAVCEGRGTENGGIYFDFSGFTDQEIDRMFDAVMEHFEGFYTHGKYHGDDVLEYRRLAKQKRRLEVGLSNEYTVGGILVNENMETGVPGLYAAGECASGVFGACRVADAVTEMICQGYKAGEKAGERAKAMELPPLSPESLHPALNHLDRLLTAEGGIHALEAREQMEAISDQTLTFLREETTLTAGIEAYDRLEAKMKQLTITYKGLTYNRELLEAIQTENRLLCSKIAAKMALLRRESRGLHIRSDYPEIDNENYIVRTIAHLDGQQDVLTHRSPITTRVPLASGGKTDYEKYLLEEDLGMANMEGK